MWYNIHKSCGFCGFHLCLSKYSPRHKSLWPSRQQLYVTRVFLSPLFLYFFVLEFRNLFLSVPFVLFCSLSCPSLENNEGDLKIKWINTHREDRDRDREDRERDREREETEKWTERKAEKNRRPSILFYSSFCSLFCFLTFCLFTLFSDLLYCFLFKLFLFCFSITLFCLLLAHVLLLFNLFSFCYSSSF